VRDGEVDESPAQHRGRLIGGIAVQLCQQHIIVLTMQHADRNTYLSCSVCFRVLMANVYVATD
jgi:hypothetical protein